MSIKEIIELLTGIGTLGASFIALFTLLEIKRQRIEANKPELTLKSTSIHIYSYKYKKFNLPLIFVKKPLKENQIADRSLLSSLFIDLINVGIHSAKNIMVYWDFNFKTAIEQINLNNKNNLFMFNLRERVLFIDFLNGELKKTNNIELYKNKHSFGFLLSSSSGSFDTVHLNFPSVVLELFLIDIYLKNSFDLIVPPKFPELKLNLEYEDIAGVHYSKKFSFDFDISFLCMPIFFDGPAHEVGQLEIKATEMKIADYIIPIIPDYEGQEFFSSGVRYF
jgi:hypothetical protein